MKRYNDYAPSVIRWNHDYPSHWACEKAKRFFNNPKTLNRNNEESNILSLTLRGVIRNNSSRPIGLSPSDYATYQIFEANELVFKLIDLENISTSRVGLVPEKGVMSSAYIRFVPRTNLNMKYFYYQYFDWYKRLIFNGLGAGVRQTLSGSDLINLEILVPPRAEQDQIVRYLDWQVSKINTLIAAKKREIELLKENADGRILDICFHGVGSRILVQSGIKWIGDIPKDWKTIRCKYCFSERDERSVNGCEEHLSMSQKHGLVPDSVLDERRMLSESYAGGKVCYRNDLVLNRLKAHLGVFALALQQGVISPDYTVLIPNTEKILPEYGMLVLKSSRCRRELRVRVRGVVEGFWRLYTDDFGTITIPCPSIKEQEKIITQAVQIREVLQKATSTIERQIDCLHEYRTRLISDVVTGQIDVRGIEIPDFEMVEESATGEDEPGEDEVLEESDEQEE